MALQLRKLGVKKVRPLEGGFEAWQALKFPTEPAVLITITNPAAAVTDPTRA